MRTVNITIKETEQDRYSAPIVAGEVGISFSVGNQSELVSSEVRETFATHGVVPFGPVSELLDLALSVYTSDQIVSRIEDGYMGWSRHIRLHFPVSNLRSWESIRKPIEGMLSFLSGDRWEVLFRQKSTKKLVQLPSIRNPISITKVSLLSGGMDSLIGAIDLLEQNEKVAFVSHYKRGTEGSRQPKLLAELKKQYGANQFRDFRFWVQPKQKNKNATKEDTSRARSFLFLSLGIAVANALGDDIDLIIPENGLISLNIPLTPTRISSHSTRTTHPYYLKMFGEIMVALGIKNQFINPYRFKTKGEMASNCRNQKLLKDIYPETISCSHPDISRVNSKGSKPGTHCGYCVPCIIRQSAEKASGLSRTIYANKIKHNQPNYQQGKGRDIRAFKMALEEIKGMPAHTRVLRLLEAGPLPFTNGQELDNYLSVFDRGMEEVNNFFQ